MTTRPGHDKHENDSPEFYLSMSIILYEYTKCKERVHFVANVIVEECSMLCYGMKNKAVSRRLLVGSCIFTQSI